MGWKGTVRSINAAIRASERDAAGRERQYQNSQKELHQRLDKADAAQRVAAYEALVRRLTSVHREQSLDLFDWEAIASAPLTSPPARRSVHEDAALDALNAYEPSLIDKVLRRTESRQEALRVGLDEGHKRDAAEHTRALRAHASEQAQVEAERQHAERILRGDLSAFDEALRRFKPFDGIGELVTAVDVRLSKDDGAPSGAEHVRVVLDIHIHGPEVIPREELRLLKSGKLSARELPVSRFHAIHQDYVCGCVLRVANEALALLPVPFVAVNALDEILNHATGHIEEQPILSVLAPRQTLAMLNLPAVDPSDAITNFVHRMSFKKTSGFSPVAALTPADLPLSA